MSVADKRSFQPTPNFRSKRQPKLVKLELYNAQNEKQEIMVRNISATGLSAAARSTPPGVNEVVTVKLPNQADLWGLVRWVDGRLFGVEFDVSVRTTGAGEFPPTRVLPKPTDG